MEGKGNNFVEYEPSDGESIIEVREELMVSPFGDSEPTLREAHFLKPSVASIDGPVWKVAPCYESSIPSSFQSKEWPCFIKFKERTLSLKKWAAWIEKMEPKHGSLWRKAGIFTGILNTRYTFHTCENLLVGIAERWCSETNTFLFPWGEATITLEDVLVLGGLSVLGDPVFRQLETKELMEVEMKLVEARKEATRSCSGKASLPAWMRLCMDSGNEFEHEAFLAAWLSLFVFYENGLIRKSVFPMAVYLARGIPVALAPAVLATIYKDLTLLKNTIASTQFQLNGNHGLEVALRSPCHLVQIWAWERIESLQPTPNVVKFEDSILARWHNVRIRKVNNMRLTINSAGESFRWRPYATLAGMCCFPKLYSDKEMWVPIDEDLDEQLQALALCLRCSMLVGLDCITRYSPHRVALQFGMDQDLSGFLDWRSETQDAAWMSYIRPFGIDLYVPSRLFESDVTKRYSEWWKKLILGNPQNSWVCYARRKRSSRSSAQARSSKQDEDKLPEVSLPGFPQKHGAQKVLGINNGVAPPAFPPKKHNANMASENLVEERKLPVTQSGISAALIPKIEIPIQMELTVEPLKGIKTEAPLTPNPMGSAVEEEARKNGDECSRLQCACGEEEEDNNGVAPPVFPPKHNANMASENLVKETKSPVTQSGTSAALIPKTEIPIQMELTVEPLREIKSEAPLTPNPMVSAVEEESRKNGSYECSRHHCAYGEDSNLDPYNVDSFNLEERISRLERAVSKFQSW